MQLNETKSIAGGANNNDPIGFFEAMDQDVVYTAAVLVYFVVAIPAIIMLESPLSSVESFVDKFGNFVPNIR